MKRPLRRVRGATATIYLSFDDGPDPEWTPRVLDLLASHGATASFFVLGEAVLRHPKLVRRAASEGHAIGHHGFAHRHPWLQLAATAREDVDKGSAAVAEVTGRRPMLYRPPFGRLKPAMLQAAARAGQQTWLWSLSAVDWGPLGDRDRIERRLLRAGAGDVILMHDARRTRNRPDQGLAALAAALRTWTSKGLELDGLPGTLSR